ncbi:hypothetical protein ABY45_15730 [Microbacterium maritypicum]|uniref:hypothetical protein n=1 Tax=Microbacterium maritypicum TaxID=33918 RepID=UPI003D6FA32A
MLNVWSRSGAVAGRGFHYQDAVGAWLSGRLIAGELDAQRIVPEGFEDLHIDGPELTFVQVKSRQEKRGAFSVGETLGFLEEMWAKHLAREAEGIASGRLMLIQERSVSGEVFDGHAAVLADLPLTHPLVEGVTERLGLDHARTLLQLTTLITLDWQDAQSAAVDAITSASGAVRGAAELIERLLRIDIATAADQNAAAPDPDNAAFVNVSSISKRIEEVLILLDRDALERALLDGICVPVQFSSDAAANDYYLGTAARPSHIASGLPAPMPDIAAQAIESLNSGVSVLLTGPSGVGKSTALWSTVYTRRDVTWYRVTRLSADAIQAIRDLLTARIPSRRNQIGLVVDGVGTGELVGWDAINQAASDFEGVMLLGTVRNEDLVSVQDRAACTIVEVALTEEVAESLHENLRRRGLTSYAHWREAYVEADGLTMEFTYMLTRGRRLRDVLRDQVLSRVRAQQETELQILALIATAGRWAISVPISELSEFENGSGSLRSALTRLNEEHLVQVMSESVQGLHPVRSRFLSEVLHELPPPTASMTTVKLVSMLPAPALPALLAGISQDLPGALPAAVEALIVRMQSGDNADVLEGLRAVKFVDLSARSGLWVEVLDRHDVQPPSKLFAIQLALIDSDLASLPFPENVSAAIAELRAAVREPFEFLDKAVQRVGVRRLGEVILDLPDSASVNQALEHSRSLAPAIASDLVQTLGRMREEGRPVRSLEVEPDLDELAELLLAAATFAPEVAELLLEAAGGADGAQQRILERFPWATTVGIVDGPEGAVFRGQILHISDRVQGDADRNAKELARLGIALNPSVVHADITTIWADGSPYEVAGHSMGVSTLRRQYLHSRSSVSGHRQTSGFAAARLHDLTATDRAEIALTGIAIAASLLPRTIRVWLRGENRPSVMSAIHTSRVELDALARRLVPVFREPIAAESSVTADSLQTLLSAIAVDIPARLADASGYVVLAAHISDTLVDAVGKARQERWEMVGADPDGLLDVVEQELQQLATVLQEVGSGGTTPQDIRRAARSGDSQQALSRAKDLSTRNALRRAERGQQERLAVLREFGRQADSYSRIVRGVRDGWPPRQYAIAVKAENVVDWLLVLERTLAALTPAEMREAYRPALVVFPEIAGRRIDSYGWQIIGSAFPIVEPLTGWGGEFPEAWETPRAEAFGVGQHALAVLSGLVLLERSRPTALLAETRLSAERELHAARAALGAYRDRITQDIAAFLDSLAVQVASEAEGDVDEMFSAQFVALLRGQQTPIARQLSMYASLAVQADIDLEVAEALAE